MKCPSCQGDTVVVDSRAVASEGVRRRRKCLSCERRFTTTEILGRPSLAVSRSLLASLSSGLKRLDGVVQAERLRLRRTPDEASSA